MLSHLIDTHSHIYLPELADSLPEMIQRAENEGVNQVLMPAIDSETHEQVLRTAREYPGVCLPMMGLHPCSVKDNYKEELAAARGYLIHMRETDGLVPVAVGECGLDYYWDKTHVVQQKEAFEEQIRWALEFDLPVVIHSRESTDDCVDIVEKFQRGNLRGVFHCFSGTEEQAKRITGLGFHLGIGGVITYKKSGLDVAIRDIPMNWLVIETDAPYLSPVPFRGKRNEPSYIVHTLQKLADSKQISWEAAAEATTNNARFLFRI